MNSPVRRILDMVQEGSVSPSEGQRLISAIEAPPRAPWYKRLFDPFANLSTGKGVLIAVATSLLSLLASQQQMRFDGALDFHLVESVTLGQALIDQAVVLPLTALVLFLAARLAKSGARPVDLFIAVGVARLPYLLLLVQGPLLRSAIASESTAMVTIFGLLVIPLLVWMLVLLFNGYRHATGLQGGRLWGAFLGGVIAAEALSKLMLSLLA